jgi:homoserine/homoserine lactone efflux protein
MAYLSLFLAFFPAYFLLAITPGLNMLTAMNLGSAIGFRRILYFIYGATLAVAIVATLSVLGVIALMMNASEIFHYLKYAGSAFLCYIGVLFWKDKGQVSQNASLNVTGFSENKLFMKGLLTALLNPKGWLFFAAFLPTFLRSDLTAWAQVVLIVVVVMIVEFICMLVYATGGKMIKSLITTPQRLRILSRINAIIMFVLAGTLVFM